MEPQPFKLRTWRLAQSQSVGALAAQMGVTVQAWYDWEKRRRVPHRDLMPKLVKLTKGAVTANDFYAQPDDLAA
ncbi:MAG: helix-turn-helix transcriptional regulator [Sandarakinorhabdus sp.]|jgi:transcriptional regulator with XRE-family HTH domain|nr:helix-turn-helix transcriptional regulator [Sandarakinorhabdus sp.]